MSEHSWQGGEGDLETGREAVELGGRPLGSITRSTLTVAHTSSVLLLTSVGSGSSSGLGARTFPPVFSFFSRKGDPLLQVVPDFSEGEVARSCPQGFERRPPEVGSLQGSVYLMPHSQCRDENTSGSSPLLRMHRERMGMERNLIRKQQSNYKNPRNYSYNYQSNTQH